MLQDGEGGRPLAGVHTTLLRKRPRHGGLRAVAEVFESTLCNARPTHGKLLAMSRSRLAVRGHWHWGVFGRRRRRLVNVTVVAGLVDFVRARSTTV